MAVRPLSIHEELSKAQGAAVLACGGLQLMRLAGTAGSERSRAARGTTRPLGHKTGSGFQLPVTCRSPPSRVSKLLNVAFHILPRPGQRPGRPRGHNRPRHGLSSFLTRFRKPLRPCSQLQSVQSRRTTEGSSTSADGNGEWVEFSVDGQEDEFENEEARRFGGKRMQVRVGREAGKQDR